jgi:hypothetical protein
MYSELKVIAAVSASTIVSGGVYGFLMGVGQYDQNNKDKRCILENTYRGLLIGLCGSIVGSSWYLARQVVINNS